MAPKTALPVERNPIRIYRSRAGYSLKRAAEFAGVTRAVWYLTECGCYDDIPPSIIKTLNYWGFESEIKSIREKYREYQYAQRISFAEEYFEKFYLPEPSNRFNPFLHWRNDVLGIPRQRLAKLICVQPALLYKVETDKAARLPEQLEEALLHATTFPEFVEELNERIQERYYRVSS